MRIRDSSWWYREERQQRLQSVSGSTLQAATRLGFLTNTRQHDKTTRNTRIIGLALLLVFLTPLAATFFNNNDTVLENNITEDLSAINVGEGSSSNIIGVTVKNSQSYVVDVTAKNSPSHDISDVTHESKPGNQVTKQKGNWQRTFNANTPGNLTREVLKEVSLKVLFFFGAVMIVSYLTGTTQHFAPHTLTELMQDACSYWQGLEIRLCSQNNLATLLKQVVFLTVCERVLLPGQRLSSLYTLMFCSIITYCVGYVAEIFNRQHWSLFVRVGGPTSSLRHLALSTTNIVLEWTKAVTFITTVVFLLLMVGLERGLDDYTPTPPYVGVATLYWLASERVCTKTITNWLLDHRLVCFETLEEVYLPFLLGIIQLSMIGLFTVPCLLTANFKLGVAGILVSRVEYLQLMQHYQALSTHLAALSPFRPASSEELSQLNDRCAICLVTMDTARVTSCQHYYHADCLLQLLAVAPYEAVKCPICQAEWQPHL